MLQFRKTADKGSQRQFAAIQDSATCKAWLGTLLHSEFDQNLIRIVELVGEVMEGPLSWEKKFDIVDRLRPVIYGAIRERIRDPDTRSVPLTLGEGEQIWRLIDAGETLREAYELFTARLPDFDATPAPVPANGREPVEVPNKVTALQRALDINAHCIVLYERMRVALPDRIWDQHCRMGQLARTLNCQNETIADQSLVAATSTCREAFVLPLLVALADPPGLSQAEFQSAYLSAIRWSGKVGFRIETEDEGEPPSRPSGVPGPAFPLGGGAYLIRLDTQKVVESLERRLEGLAEGRSPRGLGLSEGISVAAARGLLVALVRRWGPSQPESVDFPEQSWRGSTSEFALAVVGVGNGEMQRTPSSVRGAAAGSPTYDYLRMRNDGLTRSQGEIERDRVSRLLDGAETWTVVGETPDSVLSVRRHSKPRLALGQLVGVKLGGKAGPTPFLIGAVQGLQQGINESNEGVARPASTHLVRVKLIPGLPQAVRAVADGADLDPVYLMLPNVPADDSVGIWETVAASPSLYGLVLPQSTFRPGRLIRVVASGLVCELRLDELELRGLDFDHVRFSIA